MFAALKGAFRTVPEAAQKVITATNDEPWGPTGPEMDDVVKAFPQGKEDILAEMLNRMNEGKGTKWRRTYKTLLLIDHLARNLPSKGYVEHLRDFIPEIRDISNNFKYTDERGTDHGISVRERAKKLANLLSDDEELEAERNKAKATRAKLGGIGNTIDDDDDGTYKPGHRKDPKPKDTSDISSHIGGDIGIGYDPYVGKKSGTQTKSGSSALTKAQEDADYQFALKLQAEEDARAGRAPTTSAAKAAPSHPQPQQSHNNSAGVVQARTVGQPPPQQARPAVDPFAFMEEQPTPQQAPSVPQPSKPKPQPDEGDDFDSFLNARLGAPTVAPSTTSADDTSFFGGMERQQHKPPTATQPSKVDDFDFFGGGAQAAPTQQTNHHPPHGNGTNFDPFDGQPMQGAPPPRPEADPHLFGQFASGGAASPPAGSRQNQTLAQMTEQPKSRAW